MAKYRQSVKKRNPLPIFFKQNVIFVFTTFAIGFLSVSVNQIYENPFIPIAVCSIVAFWFIRRRRKVPEHELELQKNEYRMWLQGKSYSARLFRAVLAACYIATIVYVILQSRALKRSLDNIRSPNGSIQTTYKSFNDAKK